MLWASSQSQPGLQSVFIKIRTLLIQTDIKFMYKIYILPSIHVQIPLSRWGLYSSVLQKIASYMRDTVSLAGWNVSLEAGDWKLFNFWRNIKWLM
jgi:hypothetical protein